MLAPIIVRFTNIFVVRNSQVELPIINNEYCTLKERSMGISESLPSLSNICLEQSISKMRESFDEDI